MQRLWLATEGIKPRLVEICGGKGRIPGWQPTPRTIVEAFARDIHVVGVEYPVDKSGDHPACCKIGHAFDQLVHQDHSRLVATGRIGGRHGAWILSKAIIDQLLHFFPLFEH